MVGEDYAGISRIGGEQPSRRGFQRGFEMNMANETNPHRDVRLPVHLYDAAEQLIKGTRFETVDAFVAFVLQELTSRDSTKFEEQERKVIEARLRDLGYL